MPDPAPVPTPAPHTHTPIPAHIREIHKKYQKAPAASLKQDPFVLDLSNVSEYHQSRLTRSGCIPRARAERIFQAFEDSAEPPADPLDKDDSDVLHEDDIPILTHTSVPGLLLLPSLLPPHTQRTLLSRLLHRDLSNQSHLTNLTPHHNIPYHLLSPTSTLFTLPASTPLPPTNPQTHKPLTLEKALSRKLRWMTLGGQYDWTRKEYPEDTPVPFPGDIEALVNGLFPQMAPQAAIANFYSPGDMLAPHRDVAEASGRALVSMSVGCDAVFVIGCCEEEEGEKERREGEEVLVVMVKSGDVVVMEGGSRWAWHSVPRVVGGSCPEWLGAWEGGWMSGKRVNLNVRQMWD